MHVLCTRERYTFCACKAPLPLHKPNVIHLYKVENLLPYILPVSAVFTSFFSPLYAIVPLMFYAKQFR
jgi:hypothetical protein